jgi:hypothetical protein
VVGGGKRVDLLERPTRRLDLLPRRLVAAAEREQPDGDEQPCDPERGDRVEDELRALLGRPLLVALLRRLDAPRRRRCAGLLGHRRAIVATAPPRAAETKFALRAWFSARVP